MTHNDPTPAADTQDAQGKGDYYSLVALCPDAMVVLNRHASICFMNAAAQELLDEELRGRLEAHLRSRKKKSAVSTVRLETADGGVRVLRIKLRAIRWKGEPAAAGAVLDVTPYFEAIAQAQKENETLKAEPQRVEECLAASPQRTPDAVGATRLPWQGLRRAAVPVAAAAALILILAGVALGFRTRRIRSECDRAITRMQAEMNRGKRAELRQIREQATLALATAKAGQVKAEARVAAAEKSLVAEERARKDAMAGKQAVEKARDEAIRAQKKMAHELSAWAAKNENTEHRLRAEQAKQRDARQRMELENYCRTIVLAETRIHGGELERARQLLAATPVQLRGWEWRWLKRLCRREPPTRGGHGALVTSLALSAKGDILVAGGADGKVTVWDFVTGKRLRALTGHMQSVGSVAITRDGARVAGGDNRGAIRLWDVATGKVQRTLRGHSGGIAALTFAPDERLLASGDRDGTVVIWDVTDGSQVCVLSLGNKPVIAVGFSPNSRKVFTVSPVATVVWDVLSGDEVRRLELTEDTGAVVSAFAFSADGQTAATGGTDGMVKLWNAATGEKLHTLKGHSSAVVTLTFSANGQRVLSGSHDGSARVWNIDTGNPIHLLQSGADHVTSVLFSADGQRMITGGSDGKVRVWESNTGRLLLTVTAASRSADAVISSTDGTRLVAGGYDG